MQNKIITLALLLTLSSLVSADFNLGLILGPNWSRSINYSATLSSDRNVGFIGGVTFGISSGDLFEFQPEMLFVQKGSQNYVLVDTAYVNRTYLEAPLHFKWNFGPITNKVRGFAYVGPYMAILVGAHEEIGDTEISRGTGSYNLFDAGISFGAGLNIKAGVGKVIVDFRKSFGFVEIYDEPFTDNHTGNSTFALLAGYSFPF